MLLEIWLNMTDKVTDKDKIENVEIKIGEIKGEVKDERLKTFCRYIERKYGAKGRRAIRFSSRLDELDILLGLKDASKFDDEDKSYLNDEQLELLEKFVNKELKFDVRFDL